jgi:hypothetical protein
MPGEPARGLHQGALQIAMDGGVQPCCPAGLSVEAIERIAARRCSGDSRFPMTRRFTSELDRALGKVLRWMNQAERKPESIWLQLDFPAASPGHGRTRIGTLALLPQRLCEARRHRTGTLVAEMPDPLRASAHTCAIQLGTAESPSSVSLPDWNPLNPSAFCPIKLGCAADDSGPQPTENIDA